MENSQQHRERSAGSWVDSPPTAVLRWIQFTLRDFLHSVTEQVYEDARTLTVQEAPAGMQRNQQAMCKQTTIEFQDALLRMMKGERPDFFDNFRERLRRHFPGFENYPQMFVHLLHRSWRAQGVQLSGNRDHLPPAPPAAANGTAARAEPELPAAHSRDTLQTYNVWCDNLLRITGGHFLDHPMLLDVWLTSPRRKMEATLQAKQIIDASIEESLLSISGLDFMMGKPPSQQQQKQQRRGRNNNNNSNTNARRGAQGRKQQQPRNTATSSPRRVPEQQQDNDDPEEEEAVRERPGAAGPAPAPKPQRQPEPSNNNSNADVSGGNLAKPLPPARTAVVPAPADEKQNAVLTNMLQGLQKQMAWFERAVHTLHDKMEDAELRWEEQERRNAEQQETLRRERPRGHGEPVIEKEHKQRQPPRERKRSWQEEEDVAAQEEDEDDDRDIIDHAQDEQRSDDYDDGQDDGDETIDDLDESSDRAEPHYASFRARHPRTPNKPQPQGKQQQQPQNVATPRDAEEHKAEQKKPDGEEGDRQRKRTASHPKTPGGAAGASADSIPAPSDSRNKLAQVEGNADVDAAGDAKKTKPPNEEEEEDEEPELKALKQAHLPLQPPLTTVGGGNAGAPPSASSSSAASLWSASSPSPGVSNSK